MPNDDLVARIAAAIGETHALECVGCGSMSPPGARGWRAYLTIDGEAVVYCPDCAERVFGE